MAEGFQGRIPNIDVPVIGAGGRMTDEWYRFLEDLSDAFRVGGYLTTEDGEELLTEDGSYLEIQ